MASVVVSIICEVRSTFRPKRVLVVVVRDIAERGPALKTESQCTSLEPRGLALGHFKKTVGVDFNCNTIVLMLQKHKSECIHLKRSRKFAP